MLRIKQSLCGLATVLLLAVAPAAHAQWAVVDVGAIAQLVREVAVMESELATARAELGEVKQSYRAMTGHRGMASLLSGMVRNSLPRSPSQLEALLHRDTTAYATLRRAMQEAIAQHAVLTPAQLKALPTDAAARVRAARRSAALLEAIAGNALESASGRFADLQQLIDAIATASDQKASLDLEARISAEQAMLANQQTKLRVLFEAMKAETGLDLESERERIVAAQGNFRTRFQPAP